MVKIIYGGESFQSKFANFPRASPSLNLTQ